MRQVLAAETTTSFLTLEEVCDLLRIGKRTAYELARTGKLGGAVKVGGQWRVERSRFDAWVMNGGGRADPTDLGEASEP